MEATKYNHIGHNICQLRELRGMKQEGLAYAIGVSQQTISNIENSKNVDDQKLVLIGNELRVTVDAIKNFSEDALVSYLDSLSKPAISMEHELQQAKMDKVLKLYEQNQRLYEEKENLYERLLRAEQEKNNLLKKE